MMVAPSREGANVRDAPLHSLRRAEQTMRMPEYARRWTAAEVRELTDESRNWPRYELIDGELLVTPAPRPVHQIAVSVLFRRIADYVDAERLGITLTSPSDLELEPDTVTQPDIFVVPSAYSRDAGPLREWSQVRGLLLAVEIISPSSVRTDRFRKREFFQRVGVPEYWVVDLDARMVERWHPTDDAPEVLRDQLEWRPSGSEKAMLLELKAIFATVGGED
jgi:Uma2 family endonuclease